MGAWGQLREFLDAIGVKLDFLDYLLGGPHELIVFRLPQEVVEGEAAGYDELQALVQLGGQVEELLVKS
jgi:hypothetical protein